MLNHLEIQLAYKNTIPFWAMKIVAIQFASFLIFQHKVFYAIASNITITFSWQNESSDQKQSVQNQFVCLFEDSQLDCMVSETGMRTSRHVKSSQVKPTS